MTKNEVATVPLTPMDLVERALASGASMEILERMIAVQERWEANEARKAFEAAMAEAAKEMPLVEKNAQVNFEHKNDRGRTYYKHADLADVVSTVAPILGKHGLSHRFETEAAPGIPIKVTCRISHKQGHSIVNSMSAQHDPSGSKNSIQAMGSTITYLSRYTLMAVLGLAASSDDDGTSHREPQAAPDAMRRPTNARSAAGTQEQSGPASDAGAGTTARNPKTTSGSRSAASSPTKDAPASTAEKPSQPTGPQPNWVGAVPPVAKKDRSINHVSKVEAAAKLAASRGTIVFDNFWKHTQDVDDRAVVTGLGSALRDAMDRADKALAEADPQTGEISG